MPSEQLNADISGNRSYISDENKQPQSYIYAILEWFWTQRKLDA
jgi:hypothetical protein